MNEEEETSSAFSPEAKKQWEDLIHENISKWTPVGIKTPEQIKANLLRAVNTDIHKFGDLKYFKNTYAMLWGTGNTDATLVFLMHSPTAYEVDHPLKRPNLHGELELFAKSHDFYPRNLYFMYIYPWPISEDVPDECAAFFLPYLCRRLDIIRPKALIGVGSKTRDALAEGFTSKYFATTLKPKSSNKTAVFGNTSIALFTMAHPNAIQKADESQKKEKQCQLDRTLDSARRICHPNRITGPEIVENGIKKINPFQEMNRSVQLYHKQKKESPLEKLMKKSKSPFKKAPDPSPQKKSKIEEISHKE
jgi:hypothetical protein